jgi:methionine synthase II (cobalamin-independent)
LDTRFNCLPTVIGSMPNKDAGEAVDLVVKYLKDIPAWPQLPKRVFREDMNIQFSEGFPGIVTENSSVYVNHANAVAALDKLYNDYLAGKQSDYGVTGEYAAGLEKFLDTNIKPPFVKGQITGPITWGLTIKDENKKSIIYDDIIGDAVSKFLMLKASWMEKTLAKKSKNTIIFLDEPYMVSLGSAALPMSNSKVTDLINDVLRGISGLKGIHCCGNTDWPVFLSTNTNIIGFDTYNYAQSFALYPEAVKKFIERNGVVAWGIVPNTEEALKKETTASLKDRLDDAIRPFTLKGIPGQKLLEQGLLTPSCGLSEISPDAAERALELLTELSLKIRNCYI